jgi:hypothetical protein
MMRLLLVIAAIAALCATPLRAEDNDPTQGVPAQPGQQSLNVGQGVICNTLEQAKRIVSLRNEGAELPQALQRVNGEAHNPTACGAALVAFRIDQEIDGDRMEGEPVTLARIVITAISNGDQWSEVPEVVQYAIMPPVGIEI